MRSAAGAVKGNFGKPDDFVRALREAMSEASDIVTAEAAAERHSRPGGELHRMSSKVRRGAWYRRLNKT